MQPITQLACLAVPSLPLACELADRPHLRDEFVALTDDSRLRLVDVTATARSRGLHPGMTLRDAVAICPSLHVVESRPAHVARVAGSLVEALEQVTPIVEAAAPGMVFADLRGTDGLLARTGPLEQVVLGVIRPELGARLGIAERRFTAYAAALTADPGSVLRIAPGESEAFLAPLPVEWLPLDAEAVERLRLLGLRTCGALAALPRHAMEAQFGPSGGRAWLAARGDDPTPRGSRSWKRDWTRTQQPA